MTYTHNYGGYLERIAKALERIADAMEKQNQAGFPDPMRKAVW